jgi:hypothetical protein
MAAVGGRGTKLAVTALGALLAGAPASLAASPPPRQDFLAPMAHPANCGSHACPPAAGSIAISPDGSHVYVANMDRGHRGGVNVYARDPDTGALRRTTCISDAGVTPCRRPRSGVATRATWLAVSPDGLQVALVSSLLSSPALLTTYRRDPQTGALTRAGCASDRPGSTGCTRAPHIGNAQRVTFGASGRLYVLSPFGTGDDSGVTAFATDAGGAPVQVGCVTEDGSDGDCADGTGLREAANLAVTADGGTLLVTGDTVGVSTYRIDAASGALTPAGCLIGSEGGPRTCRRGLASVNGIARTADGRMLVGGERGVVDVGLSSDGDPLVGPCYGLRRPRCVSRTNAQLISVSAGGRAYASSFLEAGGTVLFVLEPTPSGGFATSGCTGGDLLPTVNLGCTTGGTEMTDLVGSPDGENVYTTARYSTPSGPQGYALAAGVSSAGAAGRGRTRTVTVRCSSARRRCEGVAKLRLVRRTKPSSGHFFAAGALLGARAFSIGPGDSARVAIRLRPSGRRKLSGKRRTAIGVVSDSSGLTVPTVARLVVR